MYLYKYYAILNTFLQLVYLGLKVKNGQERAWQVSQIARDVYEL